MSSSSSAIVTAASTGSSVPSSVLNSLPAGSYALSLTVDLTAAITDYDATADLLAQDFAFNLANETGAAQATIAMFTRTTSIGGVKIGGGSRRLLQTGTSVTYVLLGNITDAISGFSTTNAVDAFVAAAAAGTLSAPYSMATIPQQTIAPPTAVGAWSSSSTGLGDNGASSVASASAALLIAAAASMALLL